MNPPSPNTLIETAPLSDSLRSLARRGVLRQYRKGTIIISEGDVGDTIYILLQGRMRAYSVGADNNAVTFGYYGPGEYLGEMGLDGGPRSANVEATEPCTCVIVTRATLEKHLQEEPQFAFELLAKVIARARNTTTGMRQMALTDVYGRLKPLLERITEPQADGSRVANPAPTHREMAEMLGCDRAMITRLMAHLKQGGYVDAGRKWVVLLKPLPAKF